MDGSGEGRTAREYYDVPLPAGANPGYEWSHAMRAWSALLGTLATGVLAAMGGPGCSSSGTTPLSDAGADATIDGAGDANTDAESDANDANDANEEQDRLPPCVPLVAQPVASDDCVVFGGCPAACASGTATAYACVAGDGRLDAAPTYPSVFTAPIGVVTDLASEPGAFPWDAAAFISCAPLSCVRWATADHVGGGSAWPGDPCADDGADVTQAWTCPISPGVKPPPSGCFNSGPLNDLGGPGTGIPLATVWCCPAVGDGGGSGTDAATDSGTDAAAASDASESGSSDASSDSTAD
jgi:hypothetical protein